MVRRFDVYCNGGWDGCTTYEEDCDCGDYVSAVDYAELVEAVRWERECDEMSFADIWFDEWFRSEECAENAIRELRIIVDCARAAVDALVGEG